MQIVIEIPETIYDTIQSDEMISREQLAILQMHIMNGTQQKMGQWIEHFDEIGKWYECDQCHTDWGGSVNYCPNCGAKMEVKA